MDLRHERYNQETFLLEDHLSRVKMQWLEGEVLEEV